MNDAYQRYQQVQRGLGEKFLNEIDEMLGRIVDQPLMYAEIDPDIRKAIVHRFPYLVLYTVSAGDVVVLAVVHAAQDPAYIRERAGA